MSQHYFQHLKFDVLKKGYTVYLTRFIKKTIEDYLQETSNFFKTLVGISKQNNKRQVRRLGLHA